MSRSKIPYLYVTGASYSGSTLLASLLNAHPQMVSVSEMGGPIDSVIIERYFCSCGALLLQCPFFLELEQRINALGSSFSLTEWQTDYQLSKYRLLDIPLVRPLRNQFLERIRDRLIPFWPGYKETVSAISQRILHFAQAILEVSGKEVVVDAEKDSIRIKFLQDIEQLDLKVIHLIRDVRGGTASFMKNGKTDDVAWATRQWYIYNMNSERARRYISPRQWLRIKYSELCTDAQATMDYIADFVGVRRFPIPKDFYETKHHIIGNRMRLNKSPGVIKPDESWKDLFSERDLNIIARIGGAANRYFGYDWP